MNKLVSALVGFLLYGGVSGQAYFEFTVINFPETENFVVYTTDSNLIYKVREELNHPFEMRNRFISGPIAANNGGFNGTWNWHFLPNEWGLVETSMELCDGRPSDVDEYLSYWTDTVGYFCPWGSRALREINPFGLESAGNQLQVTFQNPVMNQLNLTLGTIDGKIQIELSDLTGKINQRQELSGAVHSVDCSALKPGIYLFRLSSGDQFFTGKFLKL